MSGIAETIEIIEAATQIIPIVADAVEKTQPAINTIENVLTQEIHEMIKNIHSIVAEIKESIKK